MCKGKTERGKVTSFGKSVFQKGLRSGFAIYKKNLLKLELPHFGCFFVLGSSHKENVSWGMKTLVRFQG